MALPQKRAVTASSTSSSSSVLAAGWLTTFSEIWDFLTLTKFPNGDRRKTGRLSLSLDGGQLRLSLIDEETSQYASIAGSSLDDLFLSVESAMADGSMPWRESKYQQKARR